MQILRTLFSEEGIAVPEFRITGDQPIREYTVQWNETDIAFATRLMEEEGYFYFFEHSAHDHVMVIANSNQVFVSLQNPNVSLDPVATEVSSLTSWEPSMATAWGQAALKDYDPTTLEAKQQTIEKVAGAAQRDMFHWPALSFEVPEVERRARRLMEAAEANASLVNGTGSHEGFAPGQKLVLARDPQTGAQHQEYVIRSVFHQATSEAFVTDGSYWSYANRFTAFLSSHTWREPPTMEHPRMHGVYSAVVIGPDSEEIFTDQYGRVKVLFPWDRRKDSNPDRSVWLRVVQPWAGKNWGWQFLPRVGTEVAVAFMDGDVDRPIVIGGVYNGDYMPPFPLPDEKTKSGLRTRSTLKGSTSNFSEFSIDDKKGQELVFLHAEKDHMVEVENDQKVTIGGNQTVEICKNRDITIDGGDDSLLLKQGDRSTKLSMGNMTVELSMGNLSTKAALGQISEDALQSITMTVGENSITIDQTGITISGLIVKIQGQVMAQTEAPMVQLSGDAMLTVKGGIVMIN